MGLKYFSNRGWWLGLFVSWTVIGYLEPISTTATMFISMGIFTLTSYWRLFVLWIVLGITSVLEWTSVDK